LLANMIGEEFNAAGVLLYHCDAGGRGWRIIPRADRLAMAGRIGRRILNRSVGCDSVSNAG
jgi:hypothetical protein